MSTSEAYIKVEIHVFILVKFIYLYMHVCIYMHIFAIIMAEARAELGES